MTTLYLSGPMQGYQDWNHPAFHTAAAQLRDRGYTVLNPAEYPVTNSDWSACVRRDLHDVLNSEAVATLPGWERSKGSVLEVDVAQRLGMAVCSVESLLAL